MDGLRLHVEYVPAPVRAPPAGLLRDERGRVGLVQQPQLAAGGGRVGGVQEHAAVHQGAVEVGDERADIPGQTYGQYRTV